MRQGLTSKKAPFFGLVVIGILGIGTFTLAMKTFPARLRAPFRLLPPGTLSGSLSQEQDLLTSTKDTDRDGVSDAQELQVYKTSPFLEDTDSDGKTDQAEIDAGEDPNCPAGQDCRAVRETFSSASDLSREQFQKGLYESTASAKLQQTGIPGFTDPQTVRNYLRQAGVSEELLKTISDEELVSIGTEGLKGTGESSSPPSGGVPPLGGGEPLPANPTAQQVRNLLKSAGASEDLLKALTDEQLLKLYSQTLKEVK